jgi:hypothetical protein
VFLKKNSHLTLLDVLCPRTDLNAGDGVAAAAKRKRKQLQQQQQQQQQQKDMEVTIPHPTFSHLTPSQLADPQAFVQTFYEAEREEMEAMKKLRERNRTESAKEKAAEGRALTKIECELCLELFHPSHVPLQQTVTNGGGGGSSPKQQQQQVCIHMVDNVVFFKGYTVGLVSPIFPPFKKKKNPGDQIC